VTARILVMNSSIVLSDYYSIRRGELTHTLSNLEMLHEKRILLNASSCEWGFPLKIGSNVPNEKMILINHLVY